MNFTISTIAQSLASYLAPTLPGVTFYQDPNQQGTQTPCAFIQQRYSRITPYPNGRFLREIGLDITYLEDYNLPDLQTRYVAASETLDMVMETFPYSDGNETGLIRTYEREPTIDMDALHYKFEIKVFVEQPETAVKMQKIDELNEDVITVVEEEVYT